MPICRTILAAAGAVGIATAAWAQDAPPAEPAPPAAAAHQWQEVAASSAKVYLADTADVRTLADGVAMQIALVPRTGAAGDYSHTVDQYTIRCASGEFQVAAGLAFGPDGAEEDRWTDDAAPWDPIRSGSLADAVKEIACDGAASTGTVHPTIQAFIDGGRR